MVNKHWWYWEIYHNGEHGQQLQCIAVFAETQEQAISIFTKCAGKYLLEKINLHDFPLELSEGFGNIVQMLLSRYTFEESENGKISRLYKFSPKFLILILGENTKPVRPKLDLGKLLA